MSIEYTDLMRIFQANGMTVLTPITNSAGKIIGEAVVGQVPSMSAGTRTNIDINSYRIGCN